MFSLCENIIRVYASREDLEKFKNHAADRSSVFSFQKILPVPDDILDWHDWIDSNWGVGEKELYAELTDEVDYLQYQFCTKWIPPIGIFNALMERYSGYDFEIYCWEEVYEFTYELIFKNGKVDRDIKHTWEVKDCNFNKVIRLTWEEDYLNRTVQVVENKIYEKGKVPQIPEDIFPRPATGINGKNL